MFVGFNYSQINARILLFCDEPNQSLHLEYKLLVNMPYRFPPQNKTTSRFL